MGGGGEITHSYMYMYTVNLTIPIQNTLNVCYNKAYLTFAETHTYKHMHYLK